MTAWRLVLVRRAERDLAAIPESERTSLFEALVTWAGDPFHGNVRKIEGHSGEWRWKFRRWRVIYRLDDAAQTIVALRILPRDKAYRDR